MGKTPRVAFAWHIREIARFRVAGVDIGESGKTGFQRVNGSYFPKLVVLKSVAGWLIGQKHFAIRVRKDLVNVFSVIF